VTSKFELILPDNIAIHVARSAPAAFSLLPAEIACCKRFSTKRLEDFRNGRYCASEALRQLGIDRLAMPIGESRQPLWPDGVVGSITHTSTLAGAIAARASDYAAIGLDFERLQSLDGLDDQISTDQERQAARKNVPTEHFLGILFSAKEAVYKCLWPLVRHFFSFHDVELSFTEGAGNRGAFRIRRFSGSYPHANQVKGRWLIDSDTLMAIAVLAKSNTTN
jgi:4'-phosphopantetheinyl transferase EntD